MSNLLNKDKIHKTIISNFTHSENVNNNVNSRFIHNTTQHRDFYIGFTLALLSSFFIGSSFILKKKGLLKLCESNTISNSKRAGQGGYGYLKEWLWWAGFLTMGVGELCNFAAYGFVPATLVTPLGALSVLISAIMSAYFLNEKLNTIGKIGCLLTAIGSTVMVIHAPKEGEVKNVQELIFRIQEIEFLTFSILSIIALLVLIFVIVPRYGNSNVLVYILICSILGSFTVMSCKGLSLGLKEIFTDRPSVSFIYTYLFAILVVVCIVIQMNYLNKSLDIFNTPIVTTVYYVLFTLFVMIASAVLFKEFLNVSFQDFIGCLSGFSTIICALFLIQFFKTESNEYANYKSSKDYDESIFNLIINNSKNKHNNDSNRSIDNHIMNELEQDTSLKLHNSLDNDNSGKHKLVNDVMIKGNSETNSDFNKKKNQNPSDFVQSVTIFKTVNENKIGNNSIGDNKPVSLIKKLNKNIYKNLQNNFLFNKTNKLSSNYNYNKLISEDNYDHDEDENEENSSSFTHSENNDQFLEQKNDKKYLLLNNSPNKKNDLKLNTNRRSTTTKRDSKNLSFDEKLLSKNEDDEINTTSTSLIILKS